MYNGSTAIKKIKDFFVSLFKSLAVGTIAGLLARLSAFPIMALLYNRWINILSSETVDLVYFWIGQIVGSLAFIFYMYKDLHDHNWSKLSSILGVIITIISLFMLGTVLFSVLEAM